MIDFLGRIYDTLAIFYFERTLTMKRIFELMKKVHKGRVLYERRYLYKKIKTAIVSAEGGVMRSSIYPENQVYFISRGFKVLIGKESILEQFPDTNFNYYDLDKVTLIYW